MQEIKPVSFEDLKQIFCGSDFTKRLSQAANETLKYHDETQFNILRALFADRLIYGDVVSKTDVMDNPESSADGHCLAGVGAFKEKEDFDVNMTGEELDLVKGEIFPLVMYHTHPYHYSSVPSVDDLYHLAWERRRTYDNSYGNAFDNLPLLVIGSIPNRKRLDLLVIQERLKRPMRKKIAVDISQQVEEHLNYDPSDNRVIVNILDTIPELKATLLSYRLDRDGIYRISERELRKLEKFSYTPTLLPKNP